MTCRRWGDSSLLRHVARVEAPRFFFARLARRRRAAREPHPGQEALVVRGKAPGDGVPCAGRADDQDKDDVKDKDKDDQDDATVEEATLPVLRPLGKRGAVALAVCSASVSAAEQRAAPELFDDITDGGHMSATHSVAIFRWRSKATAAHAATIAKAVDLLPSERSVAGWSCLVCSLAALMFEDMCPVFRRVRLDAAELPGHFSLFPLRGQCGWRNRAKCAGLL